MAQHTESTTFARSPLDRVTAARTIVISTPLDDAECWQRLVTNPQISVSSRNGVYQITKVAPNPWRLRRMSPPVVRATVSDCGRETIVSIRGRMSYPALAGVIGFFCFFAYAVSRFFTDGSSLRQSLQASWPFLVSTVVVPALLYVSTFRAAWRQIQAIARIIASAIEATGWTVQ
jgi:hypothetical protein